MKTIKAIAILPAQSSDHEHCSVCGDDNVAVVINGDAACHYCGNSVVLCSKHAGQMIRELVGLNLGLFEERLMRPTAGEGNGVMYEAEWKKPNTPNMLQQATIKMHLPEIAR